MTWPVQVKQSMQCQLIVERPSAEEQGRLLQLVAYSVLLTVTGPAHDAPLTRYRTRIFVCEQCAPHAGTTRGSRRCDTLLPIRWKDLHPPTVRFHRRRTCRCSLVSNSETGWQLRVSNQPAAPAALPFVHPVRSTIGLSMHLDQSGMFLQPTSYFFGTAIPSERKHRFLNSNTYQVEAY